MTEFRMERFMFRILSVWLGTVAAGEYFLPTGVLGAVENAKTDAQSFLEKAAEGRQIEISLGQLAAQRAVNERVKDLGQQMVENHKKGSQQVEQLA